MMNGRHPPAGQGMQHDAGRRRPYNLQHSQYQPVQPVYPGYINPYNPYYQQLPAHYQHGGMPPAQYPPYPPYVRSPPPQFQQYAPTPPPVVSAYTRPQHSPAVAATPYQPPPPPPPPQPTMSPYSPNSSISVSNVPAPPTPKPIPAVIPPRPQFHPPLPWFSDPSTPWPARSAKTRRARKAPKASDEAVELPTIQPTQQAQAAGDNVEAAPPSEAHPETPSTTQPLIEDTSSTTTFTPSSQLIESTPAPATSTPAPPKPASKHAAAIPIVPVIPKPVSRAASGAPASEHNYVDTSETKAPEEETATTKPDVADGAPKDEAQETKDEAQPIKAAPLTWSGLFKATAAQANSQSAIIDQVNNSGPPSLASGGKAKNETIADVLRAFSASAGKLTFLKPRGLINTGNMCYMNSVLQVLIFCIPFYNFLDLVGKRAAHSFKSDTPLIDAMIMFMREYPVIDSATSLEQLRMRLKAGELDEYGEPFTPEFVYDVIRRLPRFSSMRRGHQQDAEEFLGFLLEGLHDECAQVMHSSGSSAATSSMATPTNVPTSPVSEVASLAGSVSGEAANGWLEVGPKQKAAITRTSGVTVDSPITKIFGGTLRSELRVPGLKASVTMEPYQPLQLDIGSPQVNNIIDALKGLTRPETLHGDFKSPRGPNVAATKQVFIETLPPVLILHLKRFQYDNTGGTQKIWKKIGYPLDLEIPKEVFSRQKLAAFTLNGGLPKYRLMAVVYHHGKNASGGHYTVDVRRQDGRSWIRLDDTIIRRIGSDDVAEGGSEEDPKVIAAAMEAHKSDSLSTSNIFAQMRVDGEDEEGAAEDDWKQVNGPGSSGGTKGSGKKEKWSNVANGATTPKAKEVKSSIKDNKVAYLLFYQKVAP